MLWSYKKDQRVPIFINMSITFDLFLSIYFEDYDAEETVDNKRIEFLPIWKWLLM